MLLLVLPILSITSVLILNSSGNNLLTCTVVFAVIATVIVFFYKGSQPSSLYPLALFVVGVSLLLGSSLANTSYHIHGYDMQGEYYVYQMTAKNGNLAIIAIPIIKSHPPLTVGCLQLMSVRNHLAHHDLACYWLQWRNGFFVVIPNNTLFFVACHLLFSSQKDWSQICFLVLHC